MKKTIFFALFMMASTILLNTSCNKIKEAVKANITLTSADIEFTIPEITNIGTVSIASKDVYLNVDSIIKATNSKLSASYIKSVNVKSCTLTMLDGDANNNFSALESCKCDFSSNVNATLYTIAEITGNPDVEAYTLEIPVNSTVNLKDYFSATTFTYSVTGTARKITTKPIQCKATIRYSLEAGL
nr:hypothetical protein [Chitinophagaceae bacterium]